MSFSATGMDLETIILSESNRKRQISSDITCMWGLKYDTHTGLFTNRDIFTDMGNKLTITEEGKREEE